jgi:MFS family permease
MKLWMALGSTLLVQMVGTMSVLTLPAIGPAVDPSLDLGPARLGTFAALVYGAGLVSVLWVASRIERWGALRTSQACVLLCAGGLLLIASGRTWALMLGAVLIGLGYGPMTPASSVLLLSVAPPTRRNLVFSVKQTGVPIGGAAAGMVLPWVVLSTGWRGGPVLTAALCVLVLLLVSPLARRERRFGSPPAAAAGWRSIVAPLRMMAGDRAIAMLGLTAGCLSAVQTALSMHLVGALDRGKGMSLLAAGLMLSTLQVSGIVGRLVSGWMSDRIGSATVLLVAQASLIAFGCGAMSLASGHAGPARVEVIAVLAVILGVSALGWNGTLVAEVAVRAGAGTAASATSGVLCALSVGSVSGAYAFGAIAAGPGGYAAAFATLVLPAGVAIWALTSLRRLSRRAR